LLTEDAIKTKEDLTESVLSSPEALRAYVEEVIAEKKRKGEI
jgi:hypothetical protein